MDYSNVPYTTYLHETLSLLAKPGLLLVAAGADGAPNAMTIGWGTIGVIWRKPIFTVLVRHSRYTYKLLEESDSFTICPHATIVTSPPSFKTAAFPISKGASSFVISGAAFLLNLI